MKNKTKIESNEEENLSDIDKSKFKKLGEEEGDGPYCCGKRMIEQGVAYVCLNCGAWQYSSS